MLQLYKTIWQSEKMEISVNYYSNISKNTTYLTLKTGRRSASLLILFLLVTSSQDYSGFCRCLCDGRELGHYQYKIFVHISFPGHKIFPKLQFVCCFSLLASLPSRHRTLAFSLKPIYHIKETHIKNPDTQNWTVPWEFSVLQLSLFPSAQVTLFFLVIKKIKATSDLR